MEEFIVHRLRIESGMKQIQFQIKLPRNVQYIRHIRVTTNLNTQLENRQEVGSIWLRIPSQDVLFSEAVRSIFPQYDLTYYKPDFNNFPDARPGWYFGSKEGFSTVNAKVTYPVLEGFYSCILDPVINHIVTIYIRIES